MLEIIQVNFDYQEISLSVYVLQYSLFIFLVFKVKASGSWRNVSKKYFVSPRYDALHRHRSAESLLSTIFCSDRCLSVIRSSQWGLLSNRFVEAFWCFFAPSWYLWLSSLPEPLIRNNTSTDFFWSLRHTDWVEATLHYRLSP